MQQVLVFTALLLLFTSVHSRPQNRAKMECATHRVIDTSQMFNCPATTLYVFNEYVQDGVYDCPSYEDEYQLVG